MNIIKLQDLIYIAGFLDGDGSLMAQIVKRADYKWGYQIRLSIQFTQSSRRRIYLVKLKDIIGVGYLRDISGSKMGITHYVISEPRHVANLLQQLEPFLRIKNKQANLIIKIIEQLCLAKDSLDKFIEICLLTDQVAELNDSKNRKITAKVVMTELKTKDKEEEGPRRDLSKSF